MGKNILIHISIMLAVFSGIRDVNAFELLISDDTLQTNFWVIITKSEKQSTNFPSSGFHQLNSNYYSGLSDNLIVSYDSIFYDYSGASAHLSKVRKQHKDAYVKNVGSVIITFSNSCLIEKKAIQKEVEWVVSKDNHIFSCVTKKADSDVTKALFVGDCMMKQSSIDSMHASIPTRINCALYCFTPDLYCVVFDYSGEASTQFKLSVFNLRENKIVYSKNWSHEGGPETELISLEDYSRNGKPTLVTRRASDDTVLEILKWENNTFK